MNGNSTIGREQADAQLEAHLRFVAAHRLLDAVTTGEWVPDDEVLSHVQELVGQGRWWLATAERRSAWAAAA